jgi:hypothetical protein
MKPIYQQDGCQIPRGVIHLPKLLGKTFLSVYVQRRGEMDDFPPLAYVVDRLLGLLKVVHFACNAKKIWRDFSQKESPWTNRKLWCHLLSFVGHGADMITWAHEREYINLGKKAFPWVKSICCLAKLILYGDKLLQKSLLIPPMRKWSKWEKSFRVDDEELGKKQLTFIYLEIASHFTYLSSVSLHFTSLLIKFSVSRPLLKMLYFSSVFFSCFAQQYRKATIVPSVTGYTPCIEEIVIRS